MSKRAFVLTSVVLTLAIVSLVVTPATHSSAAGAATPTPATRFKSPPSGEDGSDVVCFDMSELNEVAPEPGRTPDVLCIDMSKVEGNAPDSQETLERLGAGFLPDQQAVEEFRGELLEVLDTLEALADELPNNYQRLGDVQRLDDVKHNLRVQRKHIQELTAREIQILHSGFKDFDAFKATLDGLPSVVQDVKRRDGTGAALDSFPIVPTPTPVSASPPLIEHQTSAHERVNKRTDDLFPPPWPTDVGCPKMGYPSSVMFSLMTSIQIGKAAQVVAQVACSEKTATCPGTNIQDPPQCAAYLVALGITTVIEDTHAGFAFCNGNVASARIQSIFEDTKVIHADLHDHDQNLTTRANATDKFLFNFRNQNMRLNIEANLASPDDDPKALLALPRRFCVSSELERLTDPTSSDYDPFAPEALAGCGLREIVRDTVRTTIDMVSVAAGADSVGNAEAEFDAAEQHFNDEEWKLAYDRYRKAYRAAVGP